MSEVSNVGTVQWKILIDRCPENTRHMLLKYIEEARQVFENYPTAAMCLLGDKVDQTVVIPDVVRSIERLRNCLGELDLILDNSSTTLQAYLQHIAPPEDLSNLQTDSDEPEILEEVLDESSTEAD